MVSVDFKEFLSQCRLLTDAELERALPAETESPSELHRAMRYAVFGGGKRLRPAVCIAAARWGGVPEESALRPAAALELLHTYTLIHDDLPCMDDDDLRRGRATVHIAFSEALALLAGDALLTLAFEWLAGGEVSDPCAARQVRELAAAAGSRGVVGGQVDDLAAEGRPAAWSEVVSIHARKTAALFRAAAVLGGIAANADASGLQALSVYGFELGMAFQVADDLLNVTATRTELGKPVGSDREKGKMTAVAALGESAARDQAAQHAAAAVAAIQSVGGNATGSLLVDLARFSIDRKY